MINFFKKHVSSLWLVMVIEAVGVIFLTTGILPREAALFLSGIFIFFVIFAPLKEALLFTAFSVPFYFALPISESFDATASWRIIIAVLFLRVIATLITNDIRMYEYNSLSSFINSRVISNWSRLFLRPFKSRLGILITSFFVLGILSLLVAQEPVFGVKKLVYLANIFVLFFVVRAVVVRKKDFTDLLKYTFAGSLTALIVGYTQFIAVLFLPLHTFWQWWAGNVIPVFYGASLAGLLSYSNTWFSYYENAEATLRMFSVFPDSHSFALLMTLSLPVALTFFVLSRSKLSKMALGAVVVFMLLSIILSGTRGLWVGAVPVFLILISVYLFFGKRIIKLAVISFLVFVLLFPVSSQLLKFSQMRQGGKVSETVFERASSSFSVRETSNMGRIQIWESTFQSIAKRPFLGVGMGNYPVVLGENISATKEGASAHSLYLNVAAEMGIFGAILVFMIFLEVLWQAIRAFVSSKSSVQRTFAGFFAVFFLWVMAYSIVDVVLLNDKVLLLFIVLASLLYVGFNKHHSL